MDSSKYRDGTCLKDSLCFIINKKPDVVPDFHKLPVTTWKLAFFSWIESQGLQRKETTERPDGQYIGIFRTYFKDSGQKGVLHAVVCKDQEVIFDILDPNNPIFRVGEFVKAFVIT